MIIDITDSQGKLPDKTAELVAAFFPYFNRERAAAHVGVSISQANAVFENEAVKQILHAITKVLLDHVDRNGRSLVPLDDDAPDAPANSGKIQEPA